MRGTAIPLFVSVAFLVVGACASASGGSLDPSECIPVEIRNNYSAAHSVEAYVEARGITPRRLGAIRPGDRRTFLFRPTAGLIEYQLHVEFLGWVGLYGEPAFITSRTFSPTPEQLVVWDIGQNMIRVVSRDPEADYGRCR